MRVGGSLAPEDLSAERRRSLLSWTHWSGSQTMVKAGSPLFISTSTSTTVVSSPLTVIARVTDIISNYIMC